MAKQRAAARPPVLTWGTSAGNSGIRLPRVRDLRSRGGGCLTPDDRKRTFGIARQQTLRAYAAASQFCHTRCYWTAHELCHARNRDPC